MSLDQVLANCASPDPNARSAAEAQLNQTIAANPRQYIADLASVLSTEGLTAYSRIGAALQLKNALQNTTQKPELENVWDTIDEPIRAEIRNKTLGTLANQDLNIRKNAAQAVATIARLDIPKQRWPEVLQILVNNSGSTESMIKHASLMTLGYICEELPSDAVPVEQSSAILTAIAAGIMPEEQDPEIKLVSGHALINSLKFISNTMTIENDRKMLFDILKSCTEFQDERVREIAFRAFAEISLQYYDFIETELGTMWDVTCNSITNDTAKVAVQAIEFWSSIADVETSRKESNPNAFAQSGKSYIKMAAQMLTPILLANIHKYDEDDDEWNLHKACSTTLGNIAFLTENMVIDQILQYVEQNIQNPDPFLRESAIVLFGSILDGPDRSRLEQTLTRIINPLLNILSSDPVPKIRETTAWTFGKICEVLTPYVLNAQIRDTVINFLVGAMNGGTSKTCAHICWAFINLAEGGDFRINGDQFNQLTEKLLDLAYSQQASDSGANVRVAAYAAIGTLIERCSLSGDPSVTTAIQSKIERFINMLSQTMNQPQNEDSQIFLCSALQSSFGALESDAISESLAENFMNTILTIFTNRGEVIEEAIQAIGALASTIETRFNKYLDKFGPFLIFSLKSHETQNICKAGTMALGDLSRALGNVMQPFLYEIIPPLLENLKNPQINTDIKVQSICTLGDLAGATKEKFLDYMNEVIGFIDSAAGASLQPVELEKDPEMFDYCLGLREAILEFYVGLIQGLIEVQQIHQIFDRVPKVLDYAMLTVQDNYKPSENVIKSVIGLMGDVAKNVPDMKNILNTANPVSFLNIHRNSPDQRIRELAGWACQQIGISY